MPREEDEGLENEGELRPIREMVPLPAGFPNDATDRVGAGELGIFDTFLQPMGKSVAESCGTLVAMIMLGEYLSERDLEWMIRERETLLPKLREEYLHLLGRGDAPPEQVMNARRFLWLLGATEGSQWMADALEVEQPAKSKQLDDLRFFVVSYGNKVPLRAGESLAAALRRCWQDPETRDDALKTALELELPEAGEAYLKALEEPGKFPRLSYLEKGLNVSQQEAAIRLITRRLETADEDETGALLNTLQSTWIEPGNKNSVSPQTQQQALRVAEDFFLNTARPHRAKAAAVLHSKGSARCLEEAERLAFEEKNESAIRIYARLAGDRMRSDFIELLNEPKAFHSVLRALGELPPDQLRPAWAAPVAAKLSGGTDQKKLVSKILAHMGMTGVEEARKHTTTLPMELVWVERGLTLQAAANGLVRLGLVDSLPAVDASLNPIDSEGLSDVMSVAGILFAFDAEHDFIPPPHHSLLMKAAGISRGKFAPLHPRQYWRESENEEAGYLVEFAQDWKLIRFSADYMSDWYDVMAVLKGANFALEKKGLPDRFVIWEEMDQVCTVVFGPLDKLQEFARQYAIPLEISSADLTEEDGDEHHRKVSKEHTDLLSQIKEAMQARKESDKKPEEQGSWLIRIFVFLVIAVVVRWCTHH